MKTTVSRYDFERSFVDAARKNQFSYEALGLLFAYLEEYEESTGEKIELDVIALCCEYSEDTVENIAENYSIDISACESDYYEISETVKAYLEDNTQLVGETSTGFVYACF